MHRAHDCAMHKTKPPRITVSNAWWLTLCDCGHNPQSPYAGRVASGDEHAAAQLAARISSQHHKRLCSSRMRQYRYSMLLHIYTSHATTLTRCITHRRKADITPATTRPTITHQNRRTRSIETHLSEASTETHATHTASATPTQRVQLPQQTPQRPPPRPPTRRTEHDRDTRTERMLPRPEHMPCNHAPRRSRSCPPQPRNHSQHKHRDTPRHTP